jgi:hypothetical protein
VTTSDDSGQYDDPDAAETSDPMADDAAPYVPPAAPAPGAGKVVLGVLAALLVAALGVALWAFVYAQMEREYVGVAVVIGLAVGWVIRVVSGRSTLPVRIVAVVVTAVACVAGTLFGDAAYTAKQFKADFFTVLGDIAPDTFDTLSKRPVLSFVIFAAGMVLAFLSAGPQKPKKSAPQVAPVEPVDADPPHPGDE